MKKQVLIIGPGMEIGGVERSLLGLLDAIDYIQFDVDLFLLNHSGAFLPYINPHVNLLPENPELSQVSKSIKSLFREGHFRVGVTRLLCKLYGDIRARIRNTDTISITLCKKILMEHTPGFPKQYDYALGFFAPHYMLTGKVKANCKKIRTCTRCLCPLSFVKLISIFQTFGPIKGNFNDSLYYFQRL